MRPWWWWERHLCSEQKVDSKDSGKQLYLSVVESRRKQNSLAKPSYMLLFVRPTEVPELSVAVGLTNRKAGYLNCGR